MKIQSMFQKDINRDINGVIKVAQDDEQSLKQELEEYIITRELRRHFNTFLITTRKPSTTQPIKSGSGFRASLEAVNPTFLKCCLTCCLIAKLDGKRAVEYSSKTNLTIR
jgi:hypothetical protein